MRINLLANFAAAANRINLLKNYSHQRAVNPRINLLSVYRRPRPSMAFLAAALLVTTLVIAGVFGMSAVSASFFLLAPVVIVVTVLRTSTPVFVSIRPVTLPAHFF
ncbi:MAG: hypothetical protein ACYS8W_15775 [Planctomycetota bacterium]|jgi:hypothetical protein